MYIQVYQTKEPSIVIMALIQTKQLGVEDGRQGGGGAVRADDLLDLALDL